MTVHALRIAATGGNALLRRIDAITTRLTNVATLPSTSRDLDLALEGEGLLRVQLPDGGVAFTRAGGLDRNAEGFLTTAAGLVVDPPLQVPPQITRLMVDADGVVSGIDPQVPEAAMPIGRIEISRFENPPGLESIGGGLFRAADAAGDRVDGPGRFRQGSIEPSPIDPMRELMDLVQTQRAYELNNRVIQALDDMLQSINTLRRKP
ncbi:MAG TPA: flagellar basal body rod C-terminal domain-containing protein [Planctomycetota bacterium]|nr:flagellar basal body rod C-terminal domain-containing protein [Planctomycetota bacterium]